MNKILIRSTLKITPCEIFKSNQIFLTSISSVTNMMSFITGWITLLNLTLHLIHISFLDIFRYYFNTTNIFLTKFQWLRNLNPNKAVVRLWNITKSLLWWCQPKRLENYKSHKIWKEPEIRRKSHHHQIII